MKCAGAFLLLVIFGGTWRFGRATCVLESDFGFVINCAFKKSGLFRVRNLGGIKAHVGLGFSVGDELGFKESLSNTDTSRRRSVQGSQFISPTALSDAQKTNGNNMSLRLSQQNALPFSLSVPPQKIKQATGSVPEFKRIPPAPERPNVALMTSANVTRMNRPIQDIPPSAMGVAIPTFNAMPASISRISQGPTVEINKKPYAVLMTVANTKNQINNKLGSNFALRTLPADQNNEFAPSPTNSIQSLLTVSNISENALEAAIMQRQQITTSTTTTTFKPPHKHATIGKVMNAPKEYYPVGYDKNFDDNFSSRVDLPDTSFLCGDQKHFPGLYADEDLGCMVFHVCALTDDGLIMKSFLCPESTLFDQTILKCNWWFYVDCKNSRKLYDSNIPISESYKLVKALTFFKTYKKDTQSTRSAKTTNPKD